VGIRKNNLKNLKILQEYKDDYRMFLEDWATLGTGSRKNDLDQESAWQIKDSVYNRYADAEEIYKTLNGFWIAKGLLGDANWAYVKGKRTETKNIRQQIAKTNSTSNKLALCFQYSWNQFKNVFFGYGESLRRMVVTYILIVFIFALIFFRTPDTNILDYIEALKMSFKNMVAITSPKLQDISILMDMLNVLQTTLGILLTGIFGFILGNKIRNQ
jgi:hypothetical protein